MAKAGLLFAGTDDGMVLFSEPGAAGRWLQVGHVLRGGPVGAVWANADNPLIVLADAGGWLQRSENGGQQWEAVMGQASGCAIISHRTTPATVYVCAPVGAVSRSDDAGATWVGLGDGGWRTTHVAQLVIDPADPQQLFVAPGDQQIYYSRDAGASWEPYGEPLPAPATQLSVAPNQPGLLYAVAGGTLYRCDAARAGWQALDATPAAAQSLAVLGGKEPVVLLGLEDGRIVRSTNGGASWETTTTDAETGHSITVILPAAYHIDTAFLGDSAGQIALSTDRGRTWRVLKRKLPAIRSIAAARLV